MYSFIAYFQNFVIGEETSKVIDIDMTQYDNEMLGGKTEVQVAWERAIYKALSMRTNVIDFVKIELLSC